MNKKVIVISVLFIAFAVYELYENNSVDLERYTIKISKDNNEFEGFKIAQISDLHLKRNKYVKDKIIKKIKKENVDIIVITGDLIDSESDIYNCGVEDFCEKLKNIAPVYSINGNHEVTLGKYKCMELLKQNNINVIDNKYITIKKEQYSFALFGSEYLEIYNKDKYKEYFINNNSIKILLSHRPDYAYEYFDKKNVIVPDIVLSGHAHGGQVVLPFIKQGLFAPNQGILPYFTDGKYYINNGVMIVSRGLGNSHNFFIRINNRVHLPIITIK